MFLSSRFRVYGLRAFLLFLFAGPFFCWGGGGPLTFFLLDFGEQRLDARGGLLDRVADEVQLGSVLEVERDAELAADVWRGLVQRLQRRGLLGVGALGRE